MYAHETQLLSQAAENDEERKKWQDFSDWVSGDGPDYKVYTIKKSNVYYTGDDNPEVISFKRTFNNQLDGQYRKDGSNKKFKDLYKNFKFTKFEDGVLDTYEWYKQNK